MRQMLIIALFLTVGGLSGPALAIAMAPPPGDGLVLVLATPWSEGAAQIIDASGGVVVGPGDTWLAAFATAPAGDSGFAGRLRAEGAWQVMDGTALADLCGVDV